MKMMEHKNDAWRGWITIVITVIITLIGSVLGLFFRAEAYADAQDEHVRREFTASVEVLRQDIRSLHNDVRELMRRSND